MQHMSHIKNKLQEGKYDEAARAFFQLIENNPDEPLHYINFANLLLELNQLEQAKHFYEAALEKDSKVATATYGIGQYYYKKSHFDKAANYFQKAISQGLEDSDVFYMLGLCFVQQNQQKLAIPYLQRAVELNESIDYLFQYGLALAQSQYLSEAKRVLEKVINKDKEHADALYNLGIIAIHENNEKVAIKFLNRTISLQEDHLLAKKAIKLLEIDGTV